MPRKYNPFRPLPQSRREKAKFHETVVHHENASFRLAAEFLAAAMVAARKGDLEDVLTNIRVANSFAVEVSFANPEEYKKSHA